MSHFFYRNPLKSTAEINFSNFHIPADVDSRSVCHEASVRRGKLLEIIKEPDSSLSGIMEALQQYIHYMYGFIVSPTDNAKFNSKIRCYTPIKWTESISSSVDKNACSHDFLFEFASMLLNVAFWYAKHAAYLSKESMNEDASKECHKCLRYAMGIITLIKDEMIGLLHDKPKELTDLHSDVLLAYYNQFAAEAQEVTTFQAIQRELSPSIISALAYETAKFYKSAELSIKECDVNVVGKWKKYLEFKNNFFMAYANCYFSKKLLNEEEGGEAIASANEAKKYLDKIALCQKQYKKAHGVYISKEIPDLKYITGIVPLVNRFHETAERENRMIYRKSVPATVPELQLKATVGLVNALLPEFKLEHHSDWSKAYNGFSDDKLTKYITDKLDKEISEEELKKEKSMKIRIIKEKPIYLNDLSKSILDSILF